MAAQQKGNLRSKTNCYAGSTFSRLIPHEYADVLPVDAVDQPLVDNIAVFDNQLQRVVNDLFRHLFHRDIQRGQQWHKQSYSAFIPKCFSTIKFS